MHHGKKLLWFCSGLLAVAGCVAVGRPLDSLPGRAPPVTLAPTHDIPLVPVPAPPLGKAEAPVSAPAGDIKPVRAEAPAATTPPVRPAAAITPPVAARPSTVRQLHQAALARYATIDSYIVRLRRQEQVKDKLNPEEVIWFAFRKEPWSVHLKWLGKEGQGREVVYVKGRYQNKLHTLLAAGDVFLMPAGKRMALAPDNILVRSASRHPITEAGIGASLDRIAANLACIERGDRRAGSLTLLSNVRRPEFDKPVQAVEHKLAPDFDATLPKGGKRTWFFDPETSLPMLIVATDERGQMVEYYRYDRLMTPVKLGDADFDPDQLWKSGNATAAR